MTIPLRSIEDVLAAVREVHSPETFERFLSTHSRSLLGARRKHEGLFTGMRVQAFQNWQLDENARLRLTDAQLLAVMRLEFPLAEGKVFTADLETALSIVAGIRAHYNRDGHNGPSPHECGMPPSVSYGTF